MEQGGLIKAIMAALYKQHLCNIMHISLKVNLLLSMASLCSARVVSANRQLTDGWTIFKIGEIFGEQQTRR